MPVVEEEAEQVDHVGAMLTSEVAVEWIGEVAMVVEDTTAGMVEIIAAKAVASTVRGMEIAVQVVAVDLKAVVVTGNAVHLPLTVVGRKK